MDIMIEVNTTLIPDFFRVEACLPNGIIVGYANVSFNNAKADLCDLFVKDDYFYLCPSFIPIYLRIKRILNFRNKG